MYEQNSFDNSLEPNHQFVEETDELLTSFGKSDTNLDNKKEQGNTTQSQDQSSDWLNSFPVKVNGYAKSVEILTVDGKPVTSKKTSYSEKNGNHITIDNIKSGMYLFSIQTVEDQNEKIFRTVFGGDNVIFRFVDTRIFLVSREETNILSNKSPYAPKESKENVKKGTVVSIVQYVTQEKDPVVKVKSAFQQNGFLLKRSDIVDKEFYNWQQDNLKSVKEVKSFKVGTGNKQVEEENQNLQKRITARREEINKQLNGTIDFLKTHPNTAWAIKKKEALEKDLKKSLEDIKNNPDSEYVSKDRRDQIKKTSNNIESMKSKVKDYDKKWHQYDEQFVGSVELMNILEAIHITPAELKALIGQESGDLTANVSTGDKAGIGQIGAKETKAVGHKAEERLDPNKAILIAAKVLQSKIKDAKLDYSKFSNPKDYKSFVFAAYNKGEGTIKKAIELAESQKGLDKYKWNDMIKDGINSPMYKSIKSNWNETALDKFNEVKSYVDQIMKRLG